MNLGAFSISLSVKDIEASKAFYEKLGFKVFLGDITQNWLIMKNSDHIIGLFQGMFEKNLLTFNPGWDQNAQKMETYTDVRELQRRLKAQGVTPVQENLYLVTTGSSNGKEFAIIPQRFNSILPKLKASDFDYIIFDMPPISQTSPTVGLAPFFDIVLTVVESEKTKRELARSAMALLETSNANVATVLNRKHNYLPRWLHEEL